MKCIKKWNAIIISKWHKINHNKIIQNKIKINVNEMK